MGTKEDNGVGDAGVDGAGSTTDQTGSEGQRDDVVSYSTHKKLLDQRKTDLQKLREYETRLNEIENERKKQEEDRLSQQGEYKKLLTLREQELAETKSKLDTTNKNIADTWKLQAIYEKLPGKIKNKEYLSFVNLEKIAFNPENGEIDPQSVDVVVNEFLEKHPSLIEINKNAKLPGTAPGTTVYKTYEEEIKTARSQREFDLIRKKYNRI